MLYPPGVVADANVAVLTAELSVRDEGCQISIRRVGDGRSTERRSSVVVWHVIDRHRQPVDVGYSRRQVMSPRTRELAASLGVSFALQA